MARQRGFPDVMTLHEAAEYLRVSSEIMHRLIRNGQIPHAIVTDSQGGLHSYRIHRSVLDAWLLGIDLRPVPGEVGPATLLAWLDAITSVANEIGRFREALDTVKGEARRR